jgi:hypothetical protein
MRLIRVDLTVRLPGRTVLTAHDEHLVAAGDEVPWSAIADVIICTDTSNRAITRVRALLARHPGCLVVAARDPGGRCVIGTRDGRIIEFTAGDPATLGSVTHAWLLTGLPLGDRYGEPFDVVVTPAGSGTPAVPGRDRPAVP